MLWGVYGPEKARGFSGLIRIVGLVGFLELVDLFLGHMVEGVKGAPSTAQKLSAAKRSPPPHRPGRTAAHHGADGAQHLVLSHVGCVGGVEDTIDPTAPWT